MGPYKIFFRSGITLECYSRSHQIVLVHPNTFVVISTKMKKLFQMKSIFRKMENQSLEKLKKGKNSQIKKLFDNLDNQLLVVRD